MSWMWQYTLLIVLPLLIQHIRLKSTSLNIYDNRKSIRAMKLFWLILFLLLALRHESIGRDLVRYKVIFGTIRASSWNAAINRSTEIGFNYLIKLISLYTNDFRWVMLVSAVVGVCFIAWVYIKNAEDASLSIALFVIMSNFVLLFSGLRQSIAISLGFLAYEFVRKRKKILFLLVVFIAMLFHSSAFMLFVMYPLYHVKITRKRLIAVIPVLGIIFIFNQQIFSTLTTILSKFTKYEAEITSTGAYTMLILFSILAVFSYLIPEDGKLDADTIGLRNFLLLSVALQMFAPLHTIAMRMNYYYIAFIPILIPKIIDKKSIKWGKVAVMARHVMVIAFITYFFLTAPSDNVLDTFPYRFYWQ